MKKTQKLFLFAVMAVLLVALLGFSASALDSDGTDFKSVLEQAIADAANGDVTVNLSGTWTATANTTIGDVTTIPTGMITISGGELETAGFGVNIAANVTFDGVKLGGTDGGSNKNGNSNVFNVGGKCVVNSNCTKGSKRANIVSADLTIHGGTFYVVAGSIAGDPFVGKTDPTITIDGNTSCYVLTGASYNGRTDLTGTATVNVGGSAGVSGYCVAANYYASAKGITAANMTINTTGTIGTAVGTMGDSGTTATYAPEVTMNIVNGTFTYGATAACVAGSGSTIYVDAVINVSGGTFTYATFFSGRPNGANEYSMNVYGDIEVNISGGTFNSFLVFGAKLGAQKDVSSLNAKAGKCGVNSVINILSGNVGTQNYCGSYFIAPGGEHSGNTTLTIAGTAEQNVVINKSIYGGSYVTVSDKTGNLATEANDCKHSGNFTANVSYAEFANHAAFYGGSCVNGSIKQKINNQDVIRATGANFDHSGTVNATLTNVVFTENDYTGSVSMSYGGSTLGGAGSKHSGEITFSLENVDIYKRIIGGSYVSGANADHCGDITLNLKNINSKLSYNDKQAQTSNAGGVFGGSVLATGATGADNSGKVVVNILGGCGDGTASNQKGIEAYFVGGSWIRGGQTVTGDSEVWLKQGLNIAVDFILYAGSQLEGEGATYAGTSTLYFDGSRAGRYYMFGGSAISYQPSYVTGESYVRVINNGNINNTTYAGSFLEYGARTIHDANAEWGVYGKSHMIVTKGSTNMTTVIAGSYIGDHSIYKDNASLANFVVGDSEFVAEAEAVINGMAVAGSKLLNAPGVKVTGTTELVIKTGAKLNAGYSNYSRLANSLICAGSWFAKGANDYNTATQSGDSILTVEGGTVSGGSPQAFFVTAGCYAETDLAEVEWTEEGVGSQYRQTGNVIANISGGTFSKPIYFAGVRSNLEGNVTINITGGTFDASSKLSLFPGNWKNRVGDSNVTDVLGMTATNYSKVKGNVEWHISGGTFTNAIRGGIYEAASYSEVGTSWYGPKQGVGYVTGDIFFEVVEGAVLKSSLAVSGLYGSSGMVVARFVGDVDMTNLSYIFSSNNAAGACTAPGEALSKKILDLSLYTGSTYAANASDYNTGTKFGVYGNRGFGVTIPPLTDVASMNVDPSTFETGDALPGTGMSFAMNYAHPLQLNVTNASTFKTVDSLTKTYEELTQYDAHFINKVADAIKFLDQTDTEITEVAAKTKRITLSLNGNEFELMDRALEVAHALVDPNFTYLGVSIRPADNGLRAKAALNETLRNATAAADGYSVKRAGILVSKTATGDLVLGGANTSVVVAYDPANGTDVYYINGEYYAFAAAVTEIPVSNYDTKLIFRPFIELEDENGNLTVLYADVSSASSELKSGENITASLRQVAQIIYDRQDQFYFDNKEKIDAILNA